MRPRGFTLLEVLVALAVLAVGLAALVQAGGAGARNAAYLKEKTLAHWVAMNKAAEYQLAGQWPGVGRRSGTVVMAGREWRWQVEVKATPDGDVRRLEVSVYPDRGEEPLVRRIAFVGRP